MKKKELKKELSNLYQKNESLIRELQEIKDLEIDKKLKAILEIAKSLDNSANLIQNYSHSDFGINSEVTINFSYNVSSIKF